jgi:G:T-mismatch repair DNA endonuclease (very short patch repair protein)
MKDIIANLVASKPKHYAKIIKGNPELLEWVKSNSKFISDSVPEMVHSTLYGSDDHCRHGSKKKFVNITTGFSGCGPAATCKCTRENISKSVAETKALYSPEQRQAINDKRSETMISRFGVMYNSQREDIHHIWKKPKIKQEAYDRLINKVWMHNEYMIKKRSTVDIADELGVYVSTVIDYCLKHGFQIRQRSNYSMTELSVCKWLDELGIQYMQGDWKIIGKELDIYIPSAKLAIEINGLYWHSWHPNSNKAEDKTRHIEKNKLATERGIDLMHVTDLEWIDKQDIIKSMLKSRLGLNQRIHARDCYVCIVDGKLERDFLNQHHIQGYVPSKLAIGLFYGDELVSIMSVGKSRFNGIAEHELLRFCTKSSITVVGGGSRLIHAIKKTHPSLMTYCDLSKGTGRGYENMGFQRVRDTDPGYFWTNGDLVISRFKSQRAQLSKWLQGYDPSKSESENMFAAGYRRFHDCGNRIFRLL